MEDTALRRNIRRVLEKMDQSIPDQAADRERMIQAVAEIQAASGQAVDLDQIGQQVDSVLAEQAQEEVVAAEMMEQEQRAKARRIPPHVLLLGCVLAIPLAFPIIRLLEVLISRLLRLFI